GGYQYRSAGENLAYGFSNASDTVAGWMNSAPHRANILDADYRNVGFGVASSPDYQGNGPATVVVAEYAQAAGTAVAAPLAGTGTPDVTSSTQPVARIQLLTGGQAAWSALALSALAGAALAVLIIRYGLSFRRLVMEGESFVAHHPMLDIAVTVIFTAGFVLTRTSGLIR
ncbi:MAG TPA: CAP domain-containing protein, partial [Candidatus Saccharimonadales bacterium]